LKCRDREWYAKRLLGSLAEITPRIIFTNSSWTAERIKEKWGVEALVLYPPIDWDYWSKAYTGPHNEKIAITIARISPEKRLEKLVDIAKLIPDWKFIIFGSADSKSKYYLREIERRIREAGLTNIEIIEYRSDEILKYMSDAKIYLHPPLSEPFGIAVAEAMAGGLVLITYCDGGAWYDIASKVDSIYATVI